MKGFSLLWSKMLDSSLWIQESKETRLVWVTMMMMKDEDGIIQSSVVGLADRAKVSVQECRTALTVFLSPDPEDTSGVEEGRRIRVVPGGWQIVNNELYRYSTEERREFWKRIKADQRAKKHSVQVKMTPDELAVWERGRAKEKKRRMKLVERNGEEVGAAEALRGGLDQAADSMARENDRAEAEPEERNM